MTERISYSARADLAEEKAANAIKVYLLRLMAAKKTNLCLSADVTDTDSLLDLADTCGSCICILKTHADIVHDFGPRTIKGLRELSRKHKFLIFEDRKFGDIGSTVQKQYSEGPLKIATWAHIINAHVFPGPSIIKSLKQAADEVVRAEQLQGSHEELENLREPPVARALLLFAQMSSEGNLMDENYTQKTVAMGRASTDFVIGYIAQRNLNDSTKGEDFLNMTPGVQLPPPGQEIRGDGLGQQYRTPAEVIGKNGCDVVIVGRGIIAAKNPREAAEQYRVAGWKAYQERILV